MILFMQVLFLIFPSNSIWLRINNMNLLYKLRLSDSYKRFCRYSWSGHRCEELDDQN